MTLASMPTIHHDQTCLTKMAATIQTNERPETATTEISKGRSVLIMRIGIATCTAQAIPTGRNWNARNMATMMSPLLPSDPGLGAGGGSLTRGSLSGSLSLPLVAENLVPISSGFPRSEDVVDQWLCSLLTSVMGDDDDMLNNKTSQLEEEQYPDRWPRPIHKV
ncbi:hypothetical protein PG993_003371 [Apiospora rasikravindrae]|uniref:Uncharacterized protein n=1 Tax=Apiospora rasikravindrae TaxID=990691 RepID=A0ABR1TZB3_9PEZI